MHPEAGGLALALSALAGVVSFSGAGGPGAGWWPLAAGGGLLVAINLSFTSQWLASVSAIAWLVGGLFLFAAARRLPDPGSRSKLKLCVALTGGALAIHGLWQVAYGFDSLAAVAVEQGASEAMRARIAAGRAVSTLGLPGALAGLLSLTLLVTAAWTAERWSIRWARWTGLALGGAQAAGLFATRSAAGVLAFFAALAGAAFLSAWSPGGARPRGRWLRASLLLAAGVLLAAVILWLRLEAPGAAARESAGPLSLRAGNWVAAMRMALDHPMAGVGAGCFGVVFPRYRTWEMNESRHAHNSYLEALAEGGVLAGLAAIVAALWLVRRLAETARGQRTARPAASWLLVAAPLSFLVHNLLDFTLYLPGVASVFFVIAGIAAGPPRAPVRAPRPAGLLTVATSLVVAGFALAAARGDALVAAARDAAVAGNHSGAEAAARAAARWNRLDPAPRSILSHAMLDRAMRGDPGDRLAMAEKDAEAAIRLDPQTPHHWRQLGRVRAARGDLLGAYAALARAAELFPTRLEYRDERDALAARLANQGAPAP